MRLLIRLLASGMFSYDLVYHRKLQGLIYNLIRDTRYSFLHGKEGCKFFSFSNILPPTQTMQEGSRKAFLVASPDRDFIVAIADKLKRMVGRLVGIGEMTFKIERFEVLELKIPEGWGECTLMTGTPIIVRIPRYRCEEYGIKTLKEYEYIYWRKDYTPTALIKQLEENLIKKYNEYSGGEAENLPLFERLRFKKQVAVPLQMKGVGTTVIGTLWEFQFRQLDDMKRNLLQFGLDAGLGEMNSLGFGFMNLMKGDIHGEEG